MHVTVTNSKTKKIKGHYFLKRTKIMESSDRSFGVTFLLCLFFGGLGAHRFYAGKVGTGFLMFFTLGGFGIWTLIDFIQIVMKNFKDSQGKVIR